MASIPLLCNICPKDPDFSDISHLLTHVSSKGHLSHYFKAQVKARQDSSIREKLDSYDRWYDRYNIEKLLSERMTAKEHKDTKTRKPSNRINPPASSKETKPRKRRATPVASQRVESPSPIKTEGVIDPQLPQSLLAAPHVLSASPFLNGAQHDMAARHRAYVPHMSKWQNKSPSPYGLPEATNSRQKSSPRPTTCPEHDTDSESGYFQSFLRSPTRTAYPDPAECSGLRKGFSPKLGAQVMTTIELQRDRSSTPEKARVIPSPILKGVKWPGMSLFDSAIFEEQRRRNQKKDDSILERMELNSVAVEQIERIYWPDGALKKARLITGYVESSPSRSPTPPHAPLKRRRTKANKALLKDLSSNDLKLRRKLRPCKTSRVPAKQASDQQDLSERTLARLDVPDFAYHHNEHMGYDPADEEESQRQLTYGDTKISRKRAFEIFSDEINDQKDASPDHYSKTNGNPLPQTLHGHHNVLQQHGPNFTRHRTPLASSQLSSGHQFGAQLDRFSWDSHLHTFSKGPLPSMPEDRENVEPVLDSEGRVDDTAGPAIYQRVTQRYFSVTGNQPPQFFNSLPPHMDLRGLAEPRYFGSTLNPLNPYLRQQLQPHQAQIHSHHSASTGCPTPIVEDLGQLSPAMT